MANTPHNIETFRKIADRTITEYIDDELTTRLRGYSFSGCKYLTHVELPNMPSLSGGYEFARCYSLEEIELPSVRTIRASQNGSYFSYAFLNCTSLKKIKLPKVRSIHQSAFYGCDVLEVMYIGTENTSITDFDGVYSLPNTIQAIYVPDDLVDAYKADSDWSEVATFIFPVSQAPDA